MSEARTFLTLLCEKIQALQAQVEPLHALCGPVPSQSAVDGIVGPRLDKGDAWTRLATAMPGRA